MVFCAQRLEHADHGRALKDDDEQAGSHGHACHANHEPKDNPYVEVEQVEPTENLRIYFLYGCQRVSGAVLVGGLVDLLGNLGSCFPDVIEAIEHDFCPWDLIVAPFVELRGGIEVYQADVFIEAREIGLVDSCDGESSGLDVVGLNEIGEDTVAAT